MSKFTPGPWTIRAAGSEIAYGNHQVAIVCRQEAGNSWAAERDANARLIAAAPCMLAFLKKWERFNIEGDNDECDEYDAELAALIAKAEGRSE